MSEQKRIFITGGASGLGRALAERYARDGYRVCIGDLNDERGAETIAALENLGAKDAQYLHCDVTKDADIEKAAKRLEENWGGVDIVINNAGVAQAGAIDEVTLDDWRWVLDVNLLGVVRGCRAFTPMFKRARSGYFVNVASMAGLLDLPMMSSYNASKAAVVSLSETLQNELMDDGIGVTVVCPSFFKTNLHETMRTPDPGLHAKMSRLLERSPITAEQIADIVFHAVKERVFYVLPHPKSRSTWMMKRVLPRAVYGSILRKQARGMRSSKTTR